MSRRHWARLSVSEHDSANETVIRSAIEGWQDDSVLVSRSSAKGNPIYDLTFSLSGGWPMSAAAKSLAYRIGKANGNPCRVGWTAWWIEDGGSMRVEWPANAPELSHVGERESELSGERELLVDLSIDPADEMKGAELASIIDGWLSRHDDYGLGLLTLADGQTLTDVVGTWRQALTAAIGGHELTVQAWNLDHPHDVRLFTPDQFPLREPEPLLGPRDAMFSAFPRFGRCMFCVTGTPVRLVGYWTEPPDPELEAAGIRAIPGRSTVAVCDDCQETLRERLPETPTQRGLFETDGNPMGQVGGSPKVACMTCQRPVSEALLVVNDANIVVCRECLLGATAA